MRNEWWIAIGVIVAMFVGIGWLVVLNENTYQVEYQQQQEVKAKNDSIIRQLLVGMDSIKDGMRNIEGISESVRNGQREQLKNDMLNRKELKQISRKIQSIKQN